MAEITLKSFILEYAKFCVESFFLFSSKKDEHIKNLETAGCCKLTPEIIREILIAELFSQHVPLALKLKEIGQQRLLDDFWSQVDYTLSDLKYFKDNKDMEKFNIMLGERYGEYFIIAKTAGNSADNFWTKNIAEAVERHLSDSRSGFLSIAISGLLTNGFVSANNLLEETFKKFDIV